MKRFVWRLQKVLDVKAKEQQIKQTELFRLTEKLAERRSELLLRQRVLHEIMSNLRENNSARRLGNQEFFLKHTATNDAEIRALREEIAQLQTEQKERTAEVLAVKRFKEGLERLRSEAKERFMREQERLEQRELDERATVAFARSETMQEDYGA
jgi:flagellar biosynthesis chaperone FliJ